ncbi:IclR family transcriptional regulator [Halobacteriales archaeon QS_1_68_17]|nr:MAG: IclR family transcriptional regulator [Halobacteriales archaeon QS_1_68_17]
MDERARNPVKSVRTALRIVEALVERDGATVTELADALPVTKGTVHNHLATLRERGYVTEEDGVYRAGLGFLYPADSARSREVLSGLGTDAVARLADTTGERVDLVARQGNHAVLLASVAGDRYEGPRGVAGERLPLYCTATGKVVLAHAADLDPERVVADATGRTDRTITDPQALESEVGYIRDEGLAYDRGEYDPHRRGIAAPLFRDGEIAGAVGIAGPADRLRGKTFQQDLPGLLVNTADQLNVELDDL